MLHFYDEEACPLLIHHESSMDKPPAMGVEAPPVTITIPAKVLRSFCQQYTIPVIDLVIRVVLVFTFKFLAVTNHTKCDSSALNTFIESLQQSIGVVVTTWLLSLTASEKYPEAVTTHTYRTLLLVVPATLWIGHVAAVVSFIYTKYDCS